MANLRRFDAPRWDWDKYLSECRLGPYFPRGITTGDLDCEVEISGRFLVLEGKREHEALSTGQRIAMDARVKDGRTVFIVYGEPPGDIRYMKQWPDGEKVPASWAMLHSAVRQWADWAEAAGRPTPRPCWFVAELERAVPA